ncbi:potassium transporter Kup [Sorangium sp. So ce693]|uniref:potassium transporter Kup n=1 Tax=Sorangium sp. So ce693 TaxID=3133318 RepID=UPI003F5EE493
MNDRASAEPPPGAMPAPPGATQQAVTRADDGPTQHGAARRDADATAAHGHHGGKAALALAALGVVFGDIGTSPLYALKECVSGTHGVPPTPDNVLGLLSLLFWSLMMVVTVKYVTFITRADNDGEGGILALLALVPERLRASGTQGVGWLAGLVVLGAALLYGDGVITPAISVLSAMEGLEVATTALKPFVVPLTCAILVGLFSVQRWGTARVGKVFGPIMVLWFTALAALGLVFIARNPAVLAALSPVYAARFFAAHGLHGVAILGSVVLVITGGEALYADMGHFGRAPIRLAWYALALPALVLNYFGQGALLLQAPEAAANPFFAMVPKGPLTYALVALAAMATVIASQALISGAYSLTHQAIQLGYLPRTQVRHTSSETAGQIYIPLTNWALAAGCLALVLIFQQSSRLAAAYGLAVTGTMGITSIVFFVVMRHTWRAPLAKALPLLILFLSFDLPFFGANLIKFLDGGYVPAVIAAVLFIMMVIWKRGRAILAERFTRAAPSASAFVRDLDAKCRARVPGTAVFLSSRAGKTPYALTHHLKHNKVLHETVVILTVVTEHVPRVADRERLDVTSLDKGVHQIVIRSGFMQSTDVPALLRRAAATHGLPIDFADVAYYLGRETILATDRGRMGRITETIFAVMARNAGAVPDYFRLPPERVVEIGVQVDL